MGDRQPAARAARPTATTSPLRAAVLRLHAAAPRGRVARPGVASATTPRPTCGASGGRGDHAPATARTRRRSSALDGAADRARPSAEEVLHPRRRDARSSPTPGALERADDDGALVALPGAARDAGCASTRGWASSPAGSTSSRRSTAALRPEALAHARATSAPATRAIAGDRAADRHQHRARRRATSARWPREHRGHPRLSPAHDRLRLRHRARLRSRRAGPRVPVPARPPDGARPHRLGARAGRDPRHGRGRAGRRCGR